MAPYVFGSLFVFVFLAPLLALAYRYEKIKNLSLVTRIILPAAAFALCPILTYSISLYLFAVCITAGFLSLFIIASRRLMAIFRNSFIEILITPVVWMGILYAFGLTPFLISAFDVGALFPQSAPLIWWLGSIGMTALIILFNSVLARFILKRGRPDFTLAFILCCIFIGVFIFSAFTHPSAMHDSGKQKRVALIQGGLPNRSIFSYEDDFDARMERYLKLSRQAQAGDPEIIIWPEYAFPIDMVKLFPQKVQPVFDEARRSWRSFVVGSMVDEPSRTDLHYNGALVIDSNGKADDVYLSRRPFVFGQGVKPATGAGKLYLDGAGLGVCWEEVSENIFRGYTDTGAGYFISLASNVALDNLWLKRYSSFFSRARSAENMRYMARSTQTGITQIIDPSGRVVARIPGSGPAFLVGDIYSIDKKSFYSRRGDILTRLALLSLILMMSFYYILKFRRRDDPSKSMRGCPAS